MLDLCILLSWFRWNDLWTRQHVATYYKLKCIKTIQALCIGFLPECISVSLLFIQQILYKKYDGWIKVSSYFSLPQCLIVTEIQHLWQLAPVLFLILFHFYMKEWNVNTCIPSAKPQNTMSLSEVTEWSNVHKSFASAMPSVSCLPKSSCLIFFRTNTFALTFLSLQTHSWSINTERWFEERQPQIWSFPWKGLTI